MKKVFSLIAVALLSTSLLFGQSTWKADPAHSKITFSVVHMGISDVACLFNTFDVSIEASKDDFSDSSFDMSIDVSSIDTEIEHRDDHLRSPDFFEVGKFPKITFICTCINKAGKNRYRVSGDMTMYCVTKPFTMELWYRGTI